MKLVTRSPFYGYQRPEDGAWVMRVGDTDVPITASPVHRDDAPDILRALFLPKDWATLERLSEASGLSKRSFAFVLPEAPTTWPGRETLRPLEWRWDLAHVSLFGS